MSPTTENGFIMQIPDFNFGYGATGRTVTEDFDVFPGLISIQTGLSRVAAVQATIGIAEFTTTDRDARPGTVKFNSHADWDPWVMRHISHFTIGGHVVGGIMKGWWTVNAWS